MTYPPCPDCGRPLWKAGGGMGGGIMPDYETHCINRGGMYCRVAAEGRRIALSEAKKGELNENHRAEL